MFDMFTSRNVKKIFKYKIHLIGLVTRLGWRYRQKISSEATKIRPGYVHVRSLSNGNWIKTLGKQCRIWTVHEYTAYIIEQTPYSTLQVYQRSYSQVGHIPPKMPDSLQKNVRQIWELTLLSPTIWSDMLTFLAIVCFSVSDLLKVLNNFPNYYY
jgi:hypothetical protein